jgi:hypothetical protein
MKNICSIPAWRSFHDGRSARIERASRPLFLPRAAGIEPFNMNGLVDMNDAGHMTE